MASTLLISPSPKQFYIEFPLYEEFTFMENQDKDGWRIKYFTGTMDAFCPECGSHSIFSRSLPINSTNTHSSDWVHDHLFEVTLKCSRQNEHRLYFIIQVNGRTMQKIGQFPSLATLNLYDVRQYASVLDKESFRELTKAIGLAAHGIGVGSFVYLRRIFESLVEQAHQIALAEEAWDEDDYSKSRMSEKILQLAHLLPDFLVENRLMYGILSKGIHELSESECLTAFPVVKIGIEIILDAKLRAAAEQKKLEAAKRAIQELAGSKSGP